MKLFYKEIARLIYFYSKKLNVSYFKLYFGWVKKVREKEN